MAVVMELKMDNTEEVLKKLEEVKGKVLEEWGLSGEGFAKKEITKVVYDTPPAPTYTRTGNLRNSLTHETDEDSAYIGTNVSYAGYVEMGTSKMKPRPYLKPAIANNADKFRQILQVYLTD